MNGCRPDASPVPSWRAAQFEPAFAWIMRMRHLIPSALVVRTVSARYAGSIGTLAKPTLRTWIRPQAHCNR
jgi:hypothetical protein